MHILNTYKYGTLRYHVHAGRGYIQDHARGLNTLIMLGFVKYCIMSIPLILDIPRHSLGPLSNLFPNLFRFEPPQWVDSLPMESRKSVSSNVLQQVKEQSNIRKRGTSWHSSPPTMAKATGDPAFSCVGLGSSSPVSSSSRVKRCFKLIDSKENARILTKYRREQNKDQKLVLFSFASYRTSMFTSHHLSSDFSGVVTVTPVKPKRFPRPSLCFKVCTGSSTEQSQSRVSRA